RIFTNCAGAAPGSASSGNGSLVWAAESHSAGDVLEFSCGAAVPAPADAARLVRVSIFKATPFAGVRLNGSVGQSHGCGGDGDGFSAAGAESVTVAGVSAPTGEASAGGTVAPGSGHFERLAGAVETGGFTAHDRMLLNDEFPVDSPACAGPDETA